MTSLLPWMSWLVPPVSTSAVVWSSIFADELPTLPPLAQWGSAVGALSLIVVGLLRGWMIPGVTHEREIAALTNRITVLDAEKVERDKQIKDQNEFMRDQLVPLTTRVHEVLTKLLEERAWDERMQRERERRSN